MKKRNIEEIAAQAKVGKSLIDLAGAYVELHRETPDEMSGPCPKCGHTDCFHVKEDWFFCRQCFPYNNGKSHDMIGFVMWMDNCTFAEACNKLGGNILPVSEIRVSPVPRKAITQDFDANKMAKHADTAHDDLLHPRWQHALDCMDYLKKRGITVDAIKAFDIGCADIFPPGAWDHEQNRAIYPNQPAIVIPWYDKDGALVAIKYRFIDTHKFTDANGKARTENKKGRGSQSGQAFGWQALRGPGSVDTLIISEGEINAISLWIAGNGRVDVLSMGSESVMANLPKSVIDLAKQYKHTVVWADKGAIADSAARLIGAASMRSPVESGAAKETDANDLLVAGKLGALVDAMIKRLSPVQREATEAAEAAVTPTEAAEAAVTPTTWESERDERWVYRWNAGLTEDTPTTRANAMAAANRLGVILER